MFSIPSLRHIRDPHSIQKLAQELFAAVDRDAGVLLGTYHGRWDASKALEKIAFSPEPQR